jgi:hypothetical protein
MPLGAQNFRKRVGVWKTRVNNAAAKKAANARAATARAARAAAAKGVRPGGKPAPNRPAPLPPAPGAGGIGIPPAVLPLPAPRLPPGPPPLGNRPRKLSPNQKNTTGLIPFVNMTNKPLLPGIGTPAKVNTPNAPRPPAPIGQAPRVLREQMPAMPRTPANNNLNMMKNIVADADEAERLRKVNAAIAAMPPVPTGPIAMPENNAAKKKRNLNAFMSRFPTVPTGPIGSKLPGANTPPDPDEPNGSSEPNNSPVTSAPGAKPDETLVVGDTVYFVNYSDHIPYEIVELSRHNETYTNTNGTRKKRAKGIKIKAKNIKNPSASLMNSLSTSFTKDLDWLKSLSGTKSSAATTMIPDSVDYPLESELAKRLVLDPVPILFNVRKGTFQVTIKRPAGIKGSLELCTPSLKGLRHLVASDKGELKRSITGSFFRMPVPKGGRRSLKQRRNRKGRRGTRVLRKH